MKIVKEFKPGPPKKKLRPYRRTFQSAKRKKGLMKYFVWHFSYHECIHSFIHSLFLFQFYQLLGINHAHSEERQQPSAERQCLSGYCYYYYYWGGHFGVRARKVRKLLYSSKKPIADQEPSWQNKVRNSIVKKKKWRVLNRCNLSQHFIIIIKTAFLCKNIGVQKCNLEQQKKACVFSFLNLHFSIIWINLLRLGPQR